MSYHFYADDSQLYLSFQPIIPGDGVLAVSNIERYAHEVDHWMLVNRLKLNKDKTELLVISAKHLPRPRTLCRQWNHPFSQKARNFGVIFENHFISKHILQVFVNHVFIISVTSDQLYTKVPVIQKYWNTCSCICFFEIGLLQFFTIWPNELPSKKVTARPECRFSSDHYLKKTWTHYAYFVKSSLASYKLYSLRTVKALNNFVPSYICDLLLPYIPSRQLRWTSKTLLSTPHFNLRIYGARSFSVAALTLRNTPPSDIKNSFSVSTLKNRLNFFL